MTKVQPTIDETMTNDPGTHDPDRDLMFRIADGDAAAYRLLVTRHLDRILAFAERHVGVRAEAEDIAQECFARVWRTAATWTPQAKVTTWLHRVTYNLCIDRLRRRRPTVDVEDTVLTDTADGPERALARAQTSDRVARAIDELPERQRAAILLVHFQELSGAEASAILDVSIEALESLLARGRRALRTALSAERHDLMRGEA